MAQRFHTFQILFLLAGVVFSCFRLSRPPIYAHRPVVGRQIPTWITLDDTNSAPIYSTNLVRKQEAFYKEAAAAAKPKLPVSARYGIAAGSNLTSLSQAELNQRFDELKQLGTDWVRFDIEWSNIQPDGPGDYRWQPYDRLVTTAAAKNLNVLGIITYTPGWARLSDCPENSKCRPKNPAQFAKFAGEVAARYAASGVNCWEIWNEPNNRDFFQPRPDLTSYGKLLELSSQSIRSSNPSAFVVSGSTSPAASDGSNISPIDFVSGLYARGLSKYFDAVGHHPYTFPQPPNVVGDHAWQQMVLTGNSIHAVMLKNGDSTKKIWITEFGSPTGGPGEAATVETYASLHDVWHVDENLQAQTVTVATELFKSYSWAGLFFWYSYKDAGTSPDSNENFFGLVRADGSKKPAYYSYQKAIMAGR